MIFLKIVIITIKITFTMSFIIPVNSNIIFNNPPYYYFVIFFLIVMFMIASTIMMSTIASIPH